MLTHHRTLNAIQRIDFDPNTFSPDDLLWLPHHAQLAKSGKKRQAEHLAGRIAAVHALREFGEKGVPGIGDKRQPLWPAGLYGSISHCGNTAVAIVATTPVGIDVEDVFTSQLAETLARDIATDSELAVLRAVPVPFPLALTLAFSAKESLYKALSECHSELVHFHDAIVIHLDAQRITVALPSIERTAHLSWYAIEAQRVLTLYHQP